MHRSFQILILSGFLLLTGLAGAVWNYVFTIQETTAQINRDWNEFTNASNAKGQLLGQIGMSLGYTGFIHNFKNYVIRHDPEYKRTVEAEFQRTSLLLDKYAALTNSPDERAAIETIRATVLLYRQELEVAAYQIGKGADISEIDKAVRVDDAPAKTALELLETTWRVAFDEGQVMINIIGNAVKFTQRGGHVQIVMSEIGTGNLQIAVTDNGPGIPNDKLDAVLRPFERMQSHIKSQVEGSGLGLPIAKYLIELHGGALTFNSEVGVGSVVTIILPRSQRSA